MLTLNRKLCTSLKALYSKKGGSRRSLFKNLISIYILIKLYIINPKLKPYNLRLKFSLKGINNTYIIDLTKDLAI